MTYFIVDAETNGLYGSFLSVAAQVYDAEWNLIEEFYGARKIKTEEEINPWVEANVLPFLYTDAKVYDEESELLETFWQFWIKYRQVENLRCVADVPYPVESRLFLRCVEQNREERMFLGPFPLYDMETILASAGEELLADRIKLLEETAGCKESELVRHCALDDVRITALLLKKYWG